jgi:DNA-binding HxlR family transcriptional regulator
LILHELTQGERDRSELASALEMSETALSQHVEMLKAGGCVFAVRRGQKVAYMLSDEGHRLAVIVVALMQRRPPLDPRRN